MSEQGEVRRYQRWWALLGVALVVLGAGGLLPVDWAASVAGVGKALANTGLSGVLIVSGAIVLVILGVPAKVARALRNTSSDQRPAVQPLRWWWVVLIALGITVVAGMALWWLMLLAEQSPPDRIPQSRIEAVRTALTLGAGLVGVVALVLTSRKQWLAEHTQRHTEADATEQRATELYTAAAEQLASDKAPVRMAGLYALERLGQYNPEHRQTVVNLLCSYLRMPFTHPDDEAVPTANLDDTHPATRDDSTQQPLLIDLAPTLATAAGLSLDGADRQHEELQVRITAQRVLTDHLWPDPDPETGEPTNRKFWQDQSLDLTGAVLDEFDLAGCHLMEARFAHASFHGLTRFDLAHFRDMPFFDGAQFHGAAMFHSADFRDGASFSDAEFYSTISFSCAHFHNWTDFEVAAFYYTARFDAAHFHASVSFKNTQFHKIALFSGMRYRHDIDRSIDKWPKGWILQAPENDKAGYVEGIEGVWGYVVPHPPGSSEPDEPGNQCQEPQLEETDSM